MSLPPERVTPDVLVVGVGNEFRRDDGAGIAAVRLLRERNLEEIRILELDGDLTGLLDHLENVETLIVIDAASSGVTPGTIHSIDLADSSRLRKSPLRSTHGLSIPEVLKLAGTQGILPKRILLYGIEGESFNHGRTMNRAVETAVHDVVRLITKEMRNYAKFPGPKK
jgi:hydrogenase maturation protease